MRTSTNEKIRCLLVFILRIIFYNKVKIYSGVFCLEFISKSTSTIYRPRNSLQSIWSLQTSPYEIRCKHEEIHLQRAIPVSLWCSPLPPKHFRGEIFGHLSRTISRVVHPQKKVHPQFRKSPVCSSCSVGVCGCDFSHCGKAPLKAG